MKSLERTLEISVLNELNALLLEKVPGATK